MNMVKVKYRAKLAALTGMAEENFEAADVKGLLKMLKARHGSEAEKEARSMLITLNGESILLLKQFRTALNDGDMLSFFPLCAGG